ncbi:MAG TPA: N-acetylmuramoyl-L-alanine amidase [Edaphobacter sp.]|nr:N-acetylmuramoyl-L-alanine amidase [Edaphobacter sp.]
MVLSPWERATQSREALEAKPARERTREDYQRTLDLFRAIYHEEPGSRYAAAAVNSVAELLAAQGRDLKDEKSLQNAVGQYEFLRKQYPGSSFRMGALLAEGQIYENDLRDEAAAREKYQLFVKLYPGNARVDEAKAALASLATPASSNRTADSAKLGRQSRLAKTASREEISRAETKTDPGPAQETSHQADRASSFSPMPTTAAETGNLRKPSRTLEAAGSVVQQAETPNPQPAISHIAAAERHGGGLAQVTGIRHWSTPNYTRVAIDLGDDVTYEAARVPNPDRIYFDLHGTRLAQSLVSKTFTVTDDGFLKQVRAAQFSNDITRVVLDVNDVTEYSAFLLPNPYRLIIDIHGSNVRSQVAGAQEPAPVVTPQRKEQPSSVPAPRTEPEQVATSRHPVPDSVATSSRESSAAVADLSHQPGRQEATRLPTSKPIAVIPAKSGGSGTSRRARRAANQVADDAAPARAAVPTADGQTSLVRALGLKIGRIVIDAGHGGHDSGTIGVDGLEEKDVVLDVALRLGKLLHERLGAEIIYTRSDDTFIPLETRTAIANKAQADLFLSIHANSSRDASARGVETYYLNFTSQPDALQVAARENAVSDQSVYQLSDLVKKIALKEKIDESREFASDVEQNLYAGLERGNTGLKNRGVKKAPFVVLIGANMPSILAEISFVTNPKDAQQLREPDYRQRVAESLYKGVAKYEAGLSGARTPVEQAQAVTSAAPPAR